MQTFLSLHRPFRAPRTSRLGVIAGAAALAALVAPSHALASGDVFVAASEGKIVTGQIEPVGGVGQNDPVDSSNVDDFKTDVRVFESEFDSFGSIDEPGFIGVSQTSHDDLGTGLDALSSSTDLDFAVEPVTFSTTPRNLWFWQPASTSDTSVSFGAPQTDDQIDIDFGPSTLATADGSNASPSALLQQTASDGGMHRHLTFNLTDASAGSTAEGIYLLSLSLAMSGFETSDPFYILFATDELSGVALGETEAHEAAVDFVATTFIPEPAVGTLLAGGALLLTRRRVARRSVA